jgi:RNA polymerase sigma factor (sigma-70 family)
VGKSEEAEASLTQLFNAALLDDSRGADRFRAVADKMYRSYSGDVVAVARRRVPGHRVDDAVSATWEAVPRALGSFQKGSSFYTWLLHIAANKATDELRRGKDGRYEALSVVISQLVGQAPSNLRPSRQVAREEMKTALHEVIAQLDAEDQELLLLHYQDGHAAADIARAKGLPPNTVAQRLVRTRNRLKKLCEAAGLE